MTIKEILHYAMVKIFCNELEEGFFLFVHREPKNMLIGSVPYTTGNITVNGQIDSQKDLSLINPESIKGMAVISEQVTYWFTIHGNDKFEILSGSNIMGRSAIDLLEITRIESGMWIVESSRPWIMAERLVFNNDDDMVNGVFNILADIGNPYNRFGDNGHSSVSSIECVIQVNEAQLIVNGHNWISFPHF